MMLEFVAIKAVEEITVHLDPIMDATRAPKMSHHRPRIEGDFPAAIVNATLPVGFFGVHEEALIEPPCPFINLLAQDHAGADNPFHVTLAVMRPAAVIAQDGVIAKERGDPKVFAPAMAWRREAEARLLGRTIGVEQLGADNSDGRMIVQEFEQRPGGARLWEGVAV